MELTCPAWLVAAPASGHGKTTVVAALARWHTRQGRRVRVFKCGPDFLDPQIHELASGAPCETIDFRMAGEEDARWRLARAARQADLILVEGVMGLHDGEPSAAELARRLHLPILLVIDASAMAGSFGAVAWGLKHYREGAPITHVLANRTGSAMHARLCRDTLPEDIAWAGHLPRDEAIALPERHLGLLPAAEIADLEARLERMAEAIGQTEAAELPPPVTFLPADTPSPLPPLLSGKTVAVARDAAFCFLYPANLETLHALGARTAFFSPLADAALPPCDAVWLPGGYPELHAAAIAANRPMAAALAAHVQAGKALLAECGGMLYLLEALTDKQDASAELLGLLPGSARLQPRLAALALQQVELPEGTLRGHTYHHSVLDCALAPLARGVCPNGKPVAEAVYRLGRLTASYIHFYLPSNPRAAAELLLP